jgi:hypothetical protein
VRLQEQYKDDSELPAFLKKKLLEPGWAGELTRDELAYIKSRLQQSPSLKRRWGFRPTAKRLSESRIRAIARNGLTPNKKPVLASAAKRRSASE